MTILITGGAGFIGSNFVHQWLSQSNETIINLDKLTYAGNLDNLKSINKPEQHIFIHGSIGNKELMAYVLATYKPRAVINFAAESHVDKSIYSPKDFITTNIAETADLLDIALEYWNNLNDEHKKVFKFIHISTDEVYGSLDSDEPPFQETNQYKPNSPYAASKAASDHLVRAYHHTYNLPTIITNCSNNYGPYQFPEKLIPLVITNALNNKPLPIYGDGKNIRDWLFVSDHCDAIIQVLEKGTTGETYNIGTVNEKTNLEVVETICKILDKIKPNLKHSYTELIQFVKDRPGHDRRYAINPTKIKTSLGWEASTNFDMGIQKTVEWYIDNIEWVENIQKRNDNYSNWINQNYNWRK